MNSTARAIHLLTPAQNRAIWAGARSSGIDPHDLSGGDCIREFTTREASNQLDRLNNKTLEGNGDMPLREGHSHPRRKAAMTLLQDFTPFMSCDDSNDPTSPPKARTLGKC
ncbi:hypothetical protein B7486_16895 [cyanobacterium TDX16]|nr:hypothetical protein B7486_16895 [cyanobacterium TDX16]